MKLYLFKRPAGLPNLSPFCVKLETYLRMAGVAYTPVFGFDSKKNNKQQMPFVELDGKFIGDSTLIIDELIRRNGDNVDCHLSATEKAVSQAFQTMLENHFAKFIIWFRWVDKCGFAQFKDVAFVGVPKFVKTFIAPMIAKKVGKNLYNEGTGRLSVDEMLHLARKDLDAVSNYLGDREFFFGDKPSMIDAIIFATIGNVALSTIDIPLRDLTLKYDNLLAHSKRMMQAYFSDIQ